MPRSTRLRERYLDTVLIGMLCLFLIALFHKTIFFAQPISRIFLIGEWDSIFDKFRTGQSMHMDPSLILMKVPYYFAVAESWRNFELPLWNSLNGFGSPLLADPQSMSFSLMLLPLTLNPTMYAYNLAIVLRSVMITIGSFLFGRTIGLSRLCAVFLALTVILCPFTLWYLELSDGYAWIPLVLYAFVRASKMQTQGSAALLGVMCALEVLSGHPEFAFCTILFGSALLLMVVPSLKASLPLLIMAAAIAFCLSAPMTVPFLEFLQNSDSYKFGTSNPAYAPWSILPLNMLQPSLGAASPFFGVVAVVALPIVAFTIYQICTKPSHASPFHQRIIMSLTALTVWAWILMAKAGPLEALLSKPPLSYIIVVYLLPIVNLFVTTLSAFGLQRLFLLAGILKTDRPDKQLNNPAQWYVAGAMVVAIILFPFAIDAIHFNLQSFDMTLPAVALDKQDWMRNSVLAVAFLLILITCPCVIRLMKGTEPAVTLTDISTTGKETVVAVYKRQTGWKGQIPLAMGLLCVAVGASSELAVSRRSLPIRPAFNYPQTDTVSKLQQLGGRIVATDEHTLRANTNLIYGLKDLRFHNPLFPNRYLDFMEQSGAKMDEFNQVFSPTLSPLLDLASVKYVVSAVDLVDPTPQTNESTKRFELVAQTADHLKVYRNNHALDEAYVVRSPVYVKSAEQALERLSSNDFDPRSELILEGEPSQPIRSALARSEPPLTRSASTPGVPSRSEPPSTDSQYVNVTRRGNLSTLIETKLKEPGYLVLTDIWYPGWQATVDGAPVDILRANYLFRAVNLNAGHHFVEFRYWPYSFMLGSSLALIVCLVGIYFLVKSPPRKIIRRRHHTPEYEQSLTAEIQTLQ